MRIDPLVVDPEGFRARCLRRLSAAGLGSCRGRHAAVSRPTSWLKPRVGYIEGVYVNRGSVGRVTDGAASDAWANPIVPLELGLPVVMSECGGPIFYYNVGYNCEVFTTLYTCQGQLSEDD